MVVWVLDFPEDGVGLHVIAGGGQDFPHLDVGPCDPFGMLHLFGQVAVVGDPGACGVEVVGKVFIDDVTGQGAAVLPRACDPVGTFQGSEPGLFADLLLRPLRDGLVQLFQGQGELGITQLFVPVAGDESGQGQE